MGPHNLTTRELLHYARTGDLPPSPETVAALCEAIEGVLECEQLAIAELKELAVPGLIRKKHRGEVIERLEWVICELEEQ